MENRNWQLRAYYLKSQLEDVKFKLGSECSFLSFERYNDLYFFKAFINNNGVRDRVRVKINRESLDLVQPKEFDELYDLLKNKRYVSQETV